MTASAGTNCYYGIDSLDESYDNNEVNCLGGANEIPSGRRNMALVRQEDDDYEPQKVLSDILAFASRGVLDAEVERTC